MIDELSLDDQYLLWGALIKVFHDHNRLQEETAMMFDWPGWSWELRSDEFDVIARFMRLIEPQRCQ